MAPPGPALCLFDVDGTLTAPRQVRRCSAGWRQKVQSPLLLPDGANDRPRVGVEGRLRTAYLFWQSLMSLLGDLEG